MSFNFEERQEIKTIILKFETIWPYYQNLEKLVTTFHGHNPLTGMPVSFIFNEPIPGKRKIISRNKISQCWFYSEDAGLSWLKIKNEDFELYCTKADVMI